MKLKSKGIENILPLTPLQEGIFFHYLKDPQSNLYFEQLSLEISSAIDVDLFEKAWNVVIQANEMLRTVFRWEKLEKPSQIILKEHPCQIRFHDFSDIDSEQKQIVLAKIKTNDRNEGFDLTQVPFRVTLCKLAEIHYEMIISNHHILYDGWSNGIILKEFFKAYHELCQGGRAIRLPVKPSFKEFIKWIQSLDKNKQEQFWRNYLAGFETASELPIKRKKAGITGADNYSIILEETIKNQLEAFVKNNRVTLASVFYSAWGILLQKYCGSEDVVFGTTVSGRSADVKGIEDMVGLFINTIPLRIDTYPGEKIIAVVSQIDHVLHEREGFENTPLVDIQSYSSLGGNGSLFDTILVIENYPLDNRLLPANSSFSIHSYSIVEMSHYDLSVGIMLFNEIEIKFSFKQELFEKETIENLAVHFKIIIQKMIEQPEMTLSQLGIISIEEKYRILYEFNNTAVEYPRDKTIHQLFAEQAAQTPGAIALVARETRTEKQEEKKRRREEEKNGDVETLRATSLQYQYQISYSQLNEQSDRLADLLIGKGVLPDTIVGIMMERSIEMITGIFGILKSGGAYLPIDPGYPQERINYMLKDSSAAILLINLELERMNNCQCSIVNCQLSTGESPGNFQHSAFELPLIQHSNHLAYIIYTSGSTGRPKGVMINHRNVVRLVKGTNYIEFLPGDSILQTGAMEFDASTFEVWGSLLNGLKLVLVNKETILIPGKLKAVLGVFAVSTIWMTSQLFNQMLQEDSEIFAGLKNLLVGGDVLSPSHIGRLKSKYPRLNVINGYGPTENTTFSTTFPIQDEYTANIPVGKPVANSTAYIVDRYNQLQPIGVPGELLVGGDGVARGYLNNPELTAFKFISVASVASVAKIYKTGDLARWLPDSNIEFLGRIDQQVKIRGFRIELGEIENRLAKHPGIKDAVVINQEENSEDKYLCAYFISNEEIAISGLRNFLARELPNYMIPSHFVQLKKIPLTPNGKLDREALPKPELKAGENYIAPRDEIETKLAVIWSEVLLIKTPIGIDDHFFQLGGHSLKATILASRIEKTFNVKILLAEIFRNPKIRELSKYIKDAAQLQYLQMEPAEKKEYYVLSSAQKRLYFLQQMDKEGTTYNIPYFMILEGIIDKNNLEHSIQQLIKSHESLRTSFVIIDEEPVQRIHEEVEFEIEYFATDELSQHGRTRIFLNYFIRPFDLSCAPLLRVGLVKMAEEKHLFLVDMHHIISDGISTQVLVQDFSDFYTGKELPGIKLQYRDYAEWQNRGRVSENIREQGKYWKKEYEGEIPVLALHNDYARPIVQVFEGDRITFEINSEISGTLKALVLELQATLYIVLLALYTILLSRLTGQEDIVIGSPVAGRRHPDLEKIIGMFVNTLALRNYPSGEKTFKGFLAEVRERTLEAFENQEFQYEDLVEQILVNRDAGRNPLFDTMFAIKNAGARKIELPGLNAVPVEYENKTAKFDLSLAGMEVEDKLSFTLEYNTKLFKRKTIENMSDYFKNMINHIILNPDVKISDVELISDETRKAQLTYLNANLKENFEAKPIQTILSDSFQKFKQNIAIEYGAVRLTYAELEHRAACISQLLAQNNIEKESFIGVYCKDKANIISAAIGILDRASIFVPLDVNLPVKRVEIAIKLADIRVILTDTGLEAILDDMKERNPNIGHIFVITGSFYQAHELDTAKAQNTRYNLEDKVYVYFTSGTTGVPNVIMGKNESLVQFLTWEIEKFSIHEGYRISQLTAVGFDAFLRDIFVPLFVGGTVCIPSPMDIERLVDWLDSNHINLVHCVPSVFRLFNVGELTGINFAHLKYILISGEPLKPNELKRWYKIFGNRIQLVNYYGPSETTMIKTYHFIRSGEAEAERIPAGLPMRGARIIILDKYLKLCGKGIVGEIYIRTPYRTYGYLNEPELNAERFIKNPLQHDDMTLLHKTGDFGKELENGEIEVLGRVDRQIKIRGVRIELENIENCLLKHDKIEKAILINRKDKNDDNYLCAYIVYKKEVFPDTGKLRSTQALREHLAKELPEYMIPSYFVPIETVPLTPNGKIDTKALALLDHEIKTDDGYIAPRNALEEKLVESWEEILGIDKGLIGIDANFFQLGGHSLKVTILLSRIHREMNVRVPMTEMFKAPTVRGLSAYIHGAGGDVSLAVEPSEAKEYYVLSSAQKRLYFLQQMDKAVTAYNIPSGWILAGAIDKYRLEQSIKKLILRHESLRTSFHMSNDETVQRVHDEVEFEIEKLDGRVDPLWSSFIRPFDLSHAPLLRVGLVKLAVEKHILLVDMHHIISDGTSINVLVQDFFALFTGEELPEIKVQYKDYAQWQYRARVSEEILEQGEYWEKQYEGEIPILELPFDYARLPIQSFEGNRINFEINRETSGALNTLALEAGATLYIVLLTIYTIFLTKLSNCEDIVIGSPIAGRRHADLEKVIGMFVNTLALRNYPSGEKKFTDFLKEVKEKTIKAFENQEYQFEDLVEKLYITRNLSRNPIFDTLFVLQNTGSQRIELPGLKLVPYEYENKTSKFDLSLSGMEMEGKLMFVFEFCTKLFKRETIERFTIYFKNIARRIVENKNQRISDLEILTEEEKNRILYEFNNTATAYPRDKTIHQLFVEQEERIPDHIAIVGGSIVETLRATSLQYQYQMSYRQLNEQSNRLAGLLIEKGVLPDTIVGIMIERSIEMIIGILGILKSGGAYLPIDPDYPQERIDYMLKDSGAALLAVANDQEGEKVRRWEGENVLLESIDHSSNYSLLQHSAFSIQQSKNLAYIIYTSGTTGNPKGVLIEHKNVVRLLFNDQFQFDFNEQDVWSLFHSTSFDFSVWEIYGALLYGGRLVVIPKMTARDPQQFLKVLIEQKVTVLNQTPSAFYNLIDEILNINSNLCIRYVIFGGEALKPARLKTWQQKYPGIKLINMFGITETCVHVTYKEIGKPEIENDISNIGKPIPTLGTYIMDQYQKLMPPGTQGELYVSGEGVARGYLNRPELTSQRFIENPYKKSERLYRSGDLSRLSIDGEMVYLGRIDKQVQLRGFRIELGEIEYRLLKHEGIKKAVVIEKNIPTGNFYLCAYIVPRLGVNPVDLEVSSLREFLAQQLPDYMIPSFYISLPEIPLTPNGKIDRGRLPEPKVKIEKDHKLPSSKMEKDLASIWQKALAIEGIGIEDNFFDTGGDSIKAIRLISRVNEHFQSNLKIVDIYTNSTIAKLAELIKQDEASSLERLYLKLTANFDELKKHVLIQGKWNPDDIEDIYPMSEIEKGMVFSYMKYAGVGIYHDQFVLPLHLNNFDFEIFRKSLRLLVEKNEILRTAFNLDEFEEPIQIVYKEPVLNLLYNDLKDLSPQEQIARIDGYLSDDRKNPFESSKSPLWRIHIFTYENDRFFLILSVHHAILDGWSNSILLTELYNTYFELKKNPLYVPPRLKACCKDAVIEERIEKENTRAVRYWQEELKDYTRLEFSDTFKSKEELEPMKIYHYNAGKEILKKAKQRAMEWRTTIKNLCFSAYAYMMRMFSYENDMVLGCVTNNRPNKLDGDNILGCFLNTIPVRLSITDGLSWKEYVAMVEQKMLEGKKHERLPLFEIALAIGEKNKDRNPIFDTLFNFTDFHSYHQIEITESGRDILEKMSPYRSLIGRFDTNTLFDFELDITSGDFFLHPKYNAQVISDYMVKKCCTYFINILEKYINSPDSLARRDDILPLEEKENLLHHFNDTAAPYSREKTMHQLFEEQVLKTKDRTAVIDSDGLGHLTYQELNERANQLAYGLRKIGVKKSDFVGVIMERCMEMGLAVMAILKAGGAYVPLEPHLPERRIEKILESLHAACVITDITTRPKLESMTFEIIIPAKTKSNEFKDNPVSLVSPGDISYIIYTSGSTGIPKGVVETHRPVVNVIEWVNKTFAVGQNDKLLFVTSLGFDLSVYDIFGILASGGTIRTAGSADMKEPLKLLAIILREGITFWDSAPAALQQLVPFFNELNEAREITNLRLIFLSGDWIPVNMPDALRNTFRGVQVISLGGATEATIWSNYYPIGHVEPSWPSIPYGKPIQNARYYILDTDLYLCPIEIGGDLYIGGECLAKEYKNDPELTAAKFSDNPFCPGEKMYKTGDIARWLADGNMQFLGRKDHQVKIRGYRIELGEIESQLASFSGLREAIVIDRKDSRGNKYICAYYIVKKAGEKISPGDLQSYLSRELPEYMMPSYFIAIDKIPVTANGKLDRKALPEPELHLTEKSYNGPGDELQEKLVDIWQEVLFGHTEKAAIGIDDDFFQLGGHSLNAAVVVAKIHKITHVKVPLAEIFRRPTIRELSELINKSNKEKYAEIQVLEKKEYYLLSSAQKRLYFLRQLEPDNVTYNLPTIISLSGEVQIKKIEDVFKYLVKRHDSLRTSFHMIGGEPVQRIHDHVEFAIEYLAADIIGDKEKNIHYSSFIIHRFIRPFDLTQVPLLRVGAVQYEEKYLLLLDMHHIITDGISTQVLKQDFMALYNGEKLPGLRIQYKDFAGWQNSNKENEELKRQELYWLKEFSEKAQAINIPTDYPRPLMQNHEGKNLIFEVPTKEAQALIALALKENATLFIILTTILNILLMKISGQEDIVIGTPAAGRGHADLEKVIGMFVNTLALRSFPLEEKKFTYYLQEVREKTIKALENQDFQYEDLIEKIIVKRDLSRNPLFDTMFTLQNMEMAAINIPSLKLSSCPYENKIAIFDLSLTAVEMEKKLMFRFEYCTKLFKEETINRFIDYFKNIINSVIENKERRIADIEIINEEEKKQILFEFNDTVRKFPKDKTIHQLFVEQALKIPDRIAVIGSNVTTVETLRATSLHLTYFQLNDQSNRLAGLLIEKGVLPDAVVGIMMEWTIEMIVGVLGILKSGGAYLPIDPGYPQERISYMLKDSGAKLLAVANNQEGEKVRKWEGEKVLLESILHPANHLFYQHSAFSILHPNHLCYIIYTSGSTGKPKGVMVEHRNVVRLVKNTDYITLSPRDRLLPTGSLAFDITTFEIWGPLCNGIMLVLVSKDILLNTGKLKKALVNYGITILHLIPALFNQLAADDMKLFAGLRYFLVGGDKVSPFYINDLRRKYNHLKILHMYGPTENTTFSTFFPVGQDYEFNIPIGKPIANNTAYIVDKFGYLQPMGVMGELCVGGEGLARGYLNNPELTTDRFNWSYKSNKTYISYKTGDLARWLPDGNIEFMGRQDNQVKIRGFRIEIGEIENLLLNHHDIGEAVVLCKKDKTNDNYLCAYIVPINTGRIDKANPVFSGLKEYLSQSLPAYMIPQYFMELEKMPLNPNGKIDRKALSELQISKFEFNKYAPPRNKIEEKLTFIWSEVLSMEKEKISIDANFFELGGHSLKATKLVTNVHKEFNVKLPLSEVFRTSTISGLAKYIKGTAAETYLSIIPTEKKEYYRLSAAQKRLYLILQMEPKSTVYNMTSAVLMEGKLDKERLEETFKKLIMRHESLRTSFHLIDGIPAQVVHESVDFKPRYYEIEAGDETAVRAKIETLVRDVTPFDLSNPPLMMVNLVKVAEMRYYMVFDMHHIISDGTSSAIFIKEFTALYDRMEFPPLKIRYCDYAEWQNREREKERIKKQEEYWLKQFEGEVPILKLPIDFSRPTLQNFEGERIFFKISGADTAALNRLALAQETTLYTVLLSLYYILLHKLSRQEDIVIGAPTAGRIHADLQDLIGMFLNTLTLRHYPGPGKTFTGFLSEVKTGVLNALENQEYQFDELVDKLELDRDTSRNPLFDVMFILQNLEIPELQIPGLKIKPTGYLTGTTKFDLSLYAIESGQVINFNFNYSTKLFEPATIEIFIKYFKNILSSVLKTPGINIADIQYVSSEDRENIVKHFNRDLRQEAEAVLAGKRVFQEKLNEIFAKYPDHTAIEYADKTITYSQLDLRSNYVARWIISQGIPKQTFIGILIDERAELITMVLGIIKAGCVFVSIDSSYPDQRIETMIETTDMKIILVDKTNNHRFANNETVKKQNVELRIFETLFLDTHLNPSWFVDKVVMEYDPADRLYILFTSGTTGKPKAIMGRNSGLLHYISWEIRKFAIKNGFRIAQLAIPSFDPFLRDVFVSLCSGGVVCIPGNKDIVMDSVALRKWLEKVRVQLIHCVPVLFKLINSAPLTAANLKDLKFILLAGEKVVPSVLAHWYEIFGERIQLVNLLGPTETTQAKICYLIQMDDVKRVRIPVGKPMDGAAVILLDDQLNVCGILEKGEIFIRTPFRSCGYFGDDELNKMKFIQNPFSDIAGDIIYRTGDMGMFLPDGKLDFVGREDRQVKIRGRRIELEEIENVLLRHPAVKEAAIKKIETPNNDELLCAYVVENSQYAGDEKLFTGTLPKYLAERLPDYMVPANIVKIEKIPRNTNGKIDYRKLPDPFAGKQKERVLPRDEIEKRVLRTWVELLKLETIGVTDSFFNSGGSSLTAISLTHKIHKEFDVRLALEDVFKSPTIAEQAKLIRTAIKEKFTAIEKAPERDYYTLSSAQKRLYIMWTIDPQNTAYNISKVIEIEGELARDKLEKCFRNLIDRHESFRTTFSIKDEDPVQEIQKEAALLIRYTDARGIAGGELKEEVDKIIRKFLEPFDLSKAPLLRVGLIEIHEKKYILLVDMHHIISDGTSLGILIKDFMTLYRGDKLTPLRLQYKDYSEWERCLFESRKMDAQEQFWLKALEGELPVLKLPLDFQRPKISDFQQGTLNFSLAEKLSTKVKQLAVETGTTLHILLLAIYNILLAKYSGQEDILVGSGIVGRMHEDLQNIIGMFVNILVMRNRPSENKTFKDFLEEVRSNAVNTYENQAYPFDRLVMKLGIEREFGRNPIVDTIFQFQNLELETLDIPGLKLKNYENKKIFTQFDLSLAGINDGDIIKMWFDYAVELFKESTVEDLKKHYQEILEQVAANQDIKLKDITISHRLKDGKSSLSKKESMDFGF